MYKIPAKVKVISSTNKKKEALRVKTMDFELKYVLVQLCLLTTYGVCMRRKKFLELGLYAQFRHM
jgi:hypothetical protein